MSTKYAKDHYAVLGVATDATKHEIEAAYRTLAKSNHPDLGGEEEVMKEVNEAYSILHDEVRRDAYDALLLEEPAPGFVVVNSPPATADNLYGQIAGAGLSIGIGLVLMFLVRFQWMFFLWPLGVLSGLVVFMGVFMAHNALRQARNSFRKDHPVRRFRLVQEAMFWSAVCAGGYGVYLIMSAV